MAKSIKLNHSGFLYIWVSNETPNWNVFFDNLSVEHFSGPLLEESHPYPGGLTMYGISDKAIKSHYVENKFGFGDKELQHQEFSDGSGLEEYEFGARLYDGQIGRFAGSDPLAHKSPNWSPYSYCWDNPEKFIDPTGMQAIYNWDDGKYYDNGQEVSWDQVQQQYGIGDYANKTSDPNNNDGASLDSKQTNSSSAAWVWHDLNKSDLLDIVGQKTGLTGGKLEDKAGKIFEQAFHEFMILIGTPGYSANSQPFRANAPGRQAVIPDGMSAAKIILVDEDGVPLDGTLVPDASWYEVKATSGTITKSSFGNQPWGLVTALALSNPIAANKGWLSLTFATTTDSYVSPELVADAKAQYHIKVTQFKAMYRETDNGYEVTFYNPDVLSYIEIKYFSPERAGVYLNFR